MTGYPKRASWISAVRRLSAGTRWLPRRSAASGVLLALSVVGGCTSGTRWVNAPFKQKSKQRDLRIMENVPYSARASEESASAEERLGVQRAVINDQSAPLTEQELADAKGKRPSIELQGAKTVSNGPVDGRLLGRFRNTYYDFPAEFNFDANHKTALMNRSCKLIAEVPRDFFEAVCVQGSGTLKNGVTVSFAKRDCSCASVCPRTGQKICFDELDQEQFPWGRGAMGQAITPLRSIAVDSGVIPLGTPVYIPEYDGVLRRPGGSPHDGCFIAEDRGMKVQGKHVDIFTGNPSITSHMNELVPSNRGVHVYVGTARCEAL